MKELLDGDIESVFLKVRNPLSKDANPILLWTSEVCRHFIFYFYYNRLQTEGDEKTWSNQTVYRMLDLFAMFFGELISGASFGEIINQAHKDRIYNINVDQRPSSSNRGDKNDAVIYQDQNASIIYEQSFGPTEYDETHYLEDITKLARNGVDDLNFHFIQYGNSSISTAKNLKSIAIHGYKYYISIYITDLVRFKTHRTYEIFKCKIPTSHTERWLLLKLANVGFLLEKLLTERKYIKERMCEEDSLTENNRDSVSNWIKVPDNTPDKRSAKK